MAVPSPTRTPRLAVSIEEACESLGVSWDHWKEHIAPHIRMVYLGRRKLVPIAELQRFLDEHGEQMP